MPVTTLKQSDLLDPRTRAGVTKVAREFMAEAKYPAEFNEQHFFEFWTTVLRADIGTFFVAKNEGGEVFGVLGALFAPDCFSGLGTGVENFWFILESERGNRDGLRLFNAFEDECDRRKCKMRIMGFLDVPGMRSDSLKKLYERRGYSPAESMVRKVV